MKALFIGGTGNISTSCTREALAKGIEVVHLNRGQSVPYPGIRTIRCDARNPAALAKALKEEHFDSVVQWICFDPEHMSADIAFFRGITDQYVFISSASAYKKPLGHHVITEATPLHNPFWEYSRKKIACENLLWEAFYRDSFPMTIVRPSHTYGDGRIPTSFGSGEYTVPQRILDGRPVVVHGGGQSLWTLTHSDDFASGFTGLLGNVLATGEAFHITSDEALTWDNIHHCIARALGRDADIVHVPVELIARTAPEEGPGLTGDKAWSVMFDNSKIKRIVPSFSCKIPWCEGVRRSLAWLDAHPEKKTVDRKTGDLMDRLIGMMKV